MRFSRGRFRNFWLGATSALALTVAGQGLADEAETHRIDIAAQSMSSALLVFSEQSGVLVVIPPELVADRTVPAVKGDLSTRDALGKLLEGSGLDYSISGDGGVTIVQQTALEREGRRERGFPGMAQADDTSPAVENSTADTAPTMLFEEIIVTARFREEGVQSIGASIAALSGDDLSRLNITDVDSLARNIAGFQNIKRQPNFNEISIRGVTNAASTFATSAPFGIFIDDVSVASRSFQPDYNMFDLNRVEVLRGPQPTLFGEGSVGGTIRYFSNDPDLDGPVMTGVAHGQFETIKDGGNAYRVENATSLVLVPGKLGVRLMGYYSEDNGFIDNPNPALNAEDINFFESVGGRVVVLAQPVDDLEIRVSAFIRDDDTGEQTQIDPGSDPQDLTFSAASKTGSSKDDVELYSARLTYDFGVMEATSITGLYKRDFTRNAFSGGNTAFFATLFPTVDPTIFAAIADDDESFSQEVRFVSNLDGPLNFIGGFFYKDVAAINSVFLDGPDFAGVTTPSTTILVNERQTRDSREYSGFVELTYEVTDRLRLIGGIRYTDEELVTTLDVNEVVALDLSEIYDEDNPIGFSDNLTRLSDAGLGNDFVFDLKRWLPRGAIEYDVSDRVLVYANVAKGARNGGTNSALSALTASGGDDARFAELLRFDEDEVLSVEWGAKTSWMEGALVANVGMYYSKYQNTQILTFTPFVGTRNGADQRVIGMEIETSYSVNDYLSSFFNVSILDGEFTDDFSSRDLSSIGIEFNVPEGNEPINAPTLSFSAGYDFAYPIANSGMNVISNGSFQYVGERFSTTENFVSTKVPSLEILNVRVGVEGERWALKLFVTNALNQIEEQFLDSNGAGAFVDADGRLDAPVSLAVVNRPRTIGVDLTIRY